MQALHVFSQAYHVLAGRRAEGQEAPPIKFDATCSFTGELNITFVGDMQDVLNLGSAAFGSTVMDLIASSVSLYLSNLNRDDDDTGPAVQRADLQSIKPDVQ